jgi:ribosomal protein S18 acetylase RimI-like enzyme
MHDDGMVREIQEGKGNVCRDVLSDLPEWFGIPEAVDAYVRDVNDLPMFGYVDGGSVIGFLSLKLHTEFAAEAYVLGVKRAWHRRGVGGCLFWRAEQMLRARRFAYLTVKTVADVSPSNAYAATRNFYEAIGFSPVEVFPTLWGPGNPCLFMIKNISV